MDGIQRRFFVGMACALLGAGLVLRLYIPAAVSPYRFAAAGALLLLFLAARDGRPLIPGAWASGPTSAKAAWMYMITAVALDLLVLLFGEHAYGVRRSLGGVLRVSALSVPLATCFAGIQSARACGRTENAAVFAVLGAHVLLLLMEPDLFAAVTQLLCLFFLAFACKGGRLQKAAFIALPLCFCFAAAIRIFSRPYLQERLASWLFPWSAPADEGSPIMSMREAFVSSGLWGAGGRAAQEAWLAMPQEFSINALPYLSIILGNAATGLCILLLSGLLVLLFFRLMRLKGTQRNMALGIWLFLAVSQLWSLGMPFGLLPLSSGYGTAFLGSGGMGCLMLLLGIFCFSIREEESASRSV